MQKFYPFLKAVPSAIALILAFSHQKPAVLLIALLFCICGDLFLAWSGELERVQKEPFFTIGIGAFGAAHIFLILYFGPRFWKLLPAAGLIVLILIVVRTGFISPGGYGFKIGLYGIIVSLMLASAISTSFFPAALLFWISDGLLGIWYFHKGAPFPIGGVALVLYYVSLFLLSSNDRFLVPII